jgi:hypothetical protein
MHQVPKGTLPVTVCDGTKKTLFQKTNIVSIGPNAGGYKTAGGGTNTPFPFQPSQQPTTFTQNVFHVVQPLHTAVCAGMRDCL